MKGTILAIAALASTATASIGLNYADIKAAPLPSVTAAPVIGKPGAVPFNSAAVASSLTDDVQPTSAPESKKIKRAECSPQAAGTGPTVSPDTDTAFSNYNLWHFEADTAIPPFPYM